MVATFWAGCAKQEATTTVTTRPQILRVSQRNEPADLDPAKVTLPDEFFIIRALSEGLLVPDPAGGAPRVAAAEQYDVSADGLTYTFHLRTGAKWSNGEPVTAGDFLESYRRLLTPATAAQKAHVFYPVKNARAFATGALADFSRVGFAAPEAGTLVVTLERPTPRFPYYVASGPWIPANPRVVAQHGRTWTQPEHFVGNGPFVLAEWRQHQRIVVKKNPAYWNAKDVKLAEIQFLHFDNGDGEERAFRAGQVDVTMSLPNTKIAVYASDRPAELHRIQLAETRYLAFNTQRPPLDDERVRRALSLVIDRQKIIDRVLLGGQLPAGRFLPPALAEGGGGRPAAGPTGSKSPSGPFPASDADALAEARRLLADAGFPDGKAFPKFELSAWSQSQVSTLEAIQAMWRQQLGIDAGITIREAKVHLAALAAGGYDIAFVTTLIDVADPAAVFGDLATGAPGNFPHWSDAAYDRELAALGTATTGAARGEAEARAESILLHAAPVAPLYYNTHLWLMSPRVRGWREDAFWTRFYVGVSLDEK